MLAARGARAARGVAGRSPESSGDIGPAHPGAGLQLPERNKTLAFRLDGGALGTDVSLMVTRYLTALAVAGSLAVASLAAAAPLERPSCGGDTKKPETPNPPKSAIPSSSADSLCGGTKPGAPQPTEPPKS
jgi:hypothetical protein